MKTELNALWDILLNNALAPPDVCCRRVTCTLAQPLKMDPERPEYHRATVSWTAGGLIAHSTGGGLSSRLLSTRWVGSTFIKDTAS